MRNALSGIERSLFWTLAFAAFAAAAAGLAARAVDHVATNYDAQQRSYAIVRVLAPEGPAAIAAAESALSASAYVVSAAPMSANRAAALLGAGGAQVDAADIPPLRLVEIEVAADAPDNVADELVAALAQGGVTAEMVSAPDTGASASVSHRVTLAAGWGAAAFAMVMALIVSLAARTLAARRRELIVAMADLGATRSQTAGRVGDEAAVIGLYAGLAGALLAAGAAGVLLFVLLPGLRFDTMQHVILPIDFAPLVAAPVGAAVAAGMGARAAAGFFFGRAARLA